MLLSSFPQTLYELGLILHFMCSEPATWEGEVCFSLEVILKVEACELYLKN